MIYLFDKDEKLIKIVRKSAVKTALQKYALTTERYVSDRLTVELKGLNADELEQVEYMAIQTMEDAHTFHYFYVAQKFSDELTTLIGVQSGIEELRKSPIFDKRPKNALARDVIADLLAGTNWQARFVGETTPHSTNFYYTSIFDALKKVCEVWDLEMQFFVEMNGNRIGARYIDFKQRIGEAVGKRVVYGHNALQILQEVERTNIFTALIGRGKGEETGDGYGRKITFEDVVWSRTQGKPVDKPKGQKYLELPLMTRQYGIKNADGSMRPKIGFVDFSEEENPEVLIERTYRALIDAARPQLTLKTSSVYLRGVKIGDTIRVVRHDKKLDYDTRIFEITFNRLNNQSSDIKLGDRIGESNEAKAQTIADKAVEQFVNNEFSNFVQNLPDYLPSADGFNNNWYGAEDPSKKYPGKVLINDIWYKPDPEHEGHKIMLRWTGEVWEEILRTYESEALRDRIAEEIAQVNQSMQAQSEEHDRQVANILSKTQSVESLANQAKSDAASALARANQVKTEAIADARAQVATVNQALNTAKSELQTAIASSDQKARDSQASATALRNDLNLQASKILEQARAQTALTSRVSTVETLADGTRSTVAELSQTVQEATQNIASVSSRTRTVEDTLSQTRTQYEALTQTVNTQTGQIESINRKTADLQSGIDGVTERFESLFIGSQNLLTKTRTLADNSSARHNTSDQFNGYTIARGRPAPRGHVDLFTQRTSKIPTSDTYIASFYARASADTSINCHFFSPNTTISVETSTGFKGVASDGKAVVKITTEWKRYWVIWKQTATATTKAVILGRSLNDAVEIELCAPALYEGTLNREHSDATEDLRSEIATYKRTAEESSAELSRQIQLADGKAVEAKTYAQQTADVIKTRLESLETYKNEEGTRANQYLTASRTETAKQITAERTAIANNYVAKSTYDENARGTTLKLNEIESTADTAKQNLATYQNTVDRKLEELTSSTQTLDGKINTASAKVDTVAGQIRTEISEVEGKIPTEVGGRNYFKKTTQISKYNQISTLTRNSKNGLDIGTTDITNALFRLHRVIVSAGYWTVSFYAKSKSTNIVLLHVDICDRQAELFEIGKDVKKYAITSLVNNWSESVYHFVDFALKSAGEIEIENLKIERGFTPSDWSPAPEDINDELSSVKTIITQTASGVEQLSTSLTTTDSKVTTAEAKIRQLISDVSSKVSQTDYNTLTGRVDSAETAITQNATEISKRLTSTQVESAITGKGYQTKSDVDSNITGRGYITNSALQPYALSTTVQNLVQETADSFSRTISRVENKIPTKIGVTNLLGGTSSDWKTIRVTQYNGLIKSYNPQEWALLNIKTGDSVTFSVDVKTTSGKKLRSRISFYGPNTHYYSEAFVVNGEGRLSVTGVVPDGITSVQLFVDANLTMTTNTEVTEESCRREKLEKGAIPTDWSPAPEDLATVTALHSVRDTVDSHTRTIGAVGTAGSILDNVSKVTQTAAGLVQEVSGTNGLKTQVSQLKNSWAVKISGPEGLKTAINASEDGVRLKGKNLWLDGNTLINNAVITSAMIAGLDAGKINTGELNAARIKANSIDGSKIVFDQAFLNKMTANEAYLRQLFAKDAFLTAVQAVSISASQITGGLMRATNGAMEVNLNAGQIMYYTDQAALKRVLTGYPTQFVKFATGTVSGKGNAGVTVIGSNRWDSESSNDGGFVGIRAWNGSNIDQIDVVGDTVRLASSTFESADGWTINTLPGKLDIDAFNSSDRPSSRLSIGDVKLFRTSTSYVSLMDVLHQFNHNFKHLQNITGRGDVILTWDTIK